jgi:hypothetical protein
VTGDLNRRDPNRVRTDPQPLPPRPDAGYVDPTVLFYGDVDHAQIERTVRSLYR